MAAPPVAGGVGKGDAGGAPRVIGRKLQALDIDGESLGSP